jgi:hypothetical protein
VATFFPSAGVARLAVISDCPIDDELIRVLRPLWGDGTTDADLVFDASRRSCQWPCSVPWEGGEVRHLGFHLYLCANFLWRHREIVDRIHQLGCNVELCLDISVQSEDFSLAAATMKHLADLQIQLSFHPVTRSELLSSA